MVSWRSALPVGAALMGLVAGFLIVSAARESAVAPIDRVVQIETTACGYSSATSGTGVLIGPGRVLTVAHTVSGAGAVTVEYANEELAATVVAYDQRSDLAVLAVDEAATSDSISTVAPAATRAGEVVTIFGSESGAVPSTITKMVTIRIDGVRSSERGDRMGFLLDADIRLGDSGGPVFDTNDDLVGIVFGRSPATSSRTFAIRAEEIEAVLSQTPTTWRCDPTDHELVPG